MENFACQILLLYYISTISISDDSSDCYRKCDKDSGCNFFAFQGRGENKGICRLFAKLDESKIQHDDWISGEKKCIPGPSGEKGKFG